MRKYDSNGNPTISIGTKAMVIGSGISNEANKEISRTAPDERDNVTVGNNKISPWGINNDYPDFLYTNYISKSTVLRAAIDFRKKVTCGQGLYAVKLEDISASGNEVLKLSSDEEAKLFVRSRNVKKYHSRFFHEGYSFGMSFVELILNEAGNKIVGIDVKRSRDCRLTEMKDGVIENCILKGDWALTGTNPDAIIPVLDCYDPLYDLQSRKNSKDRKYILPVRFNDDFHYYATPSFETARLAGWLDVAISVPDYLKNMFKNQMSLKYIVRIPYAYWDKKYPKGMYKDAVERQRLIDAELDDLETNLTDTENAAKTFITHFELNSQGKPEEKWEFEVMEDKFKNDMYLPHSAAANGEILFSMQVNPSSIGAGMPGGPYSGSAGSGSDIRESLLVNVALSWADRELCTDPLYVIRDFNGWDPETEFRTINTVLTTLDSGAGTAKTLS